MSSENKRLAQKSAACKWKKGNFSDVEYELPLEVPFNLCLNGKSMATLMSSPDSFKELSIGFLASSGVLTTAGQVENFSLDTNSLTGNIIAPSANMPENSDFKIYSVGCGSAVIYFKGQDIPSQVPITQTVKISPNQLYQLTHSFNSHSKHTKPAGGLHAARFSLTTSEESPVMWDVGRHNAVDKAIGHALMRNWPLNKGIVICSGRISSEICYKLGHCRIPLIISLGTPTRHAVLLADNMGITLIGLARGGQFSIFSRKGRTLS